MFQLIFIFGLEFLLQLSSIFDILISFLNGLKLSFFFHIFFLQFLKFHLSLLYYHFKFLLLVETIKQVNILLIMLVVFFIQIKMLHDLIENILIVFFIFNKTTFFCFIKLFLFFILNMNASGLLIELFSLLINFLENQLIIFFHLFMELFSVFQGLLNLFVECCLIFNFFVAVQKELLC